MAPHPEGPLISGETYAARSSSSHQLRDGLTARQGDATHRAHTDGAALFSRQRNRAAPRHRQREESALPHPKDSATAGRSLPTTARADEPGSEALPDVAAASGQPLTQRPPPCLPAGSRSGAGSGSGSGGSATAELLRRPCGVRRKRCGAERNGAGIMSGREGKAGPGGCRRRLCRLLSSHRPLSF